MKTDQYTEKLVVRLKAHARPSNALPMQKYMKDLFPFYGIKSPERNTQLKSFIAEFGLPENWKEVVSDCWKREEREMQYVGMELTYRSRKKWTKEDLGFFEFMIVEKSWWDTVDYIASNIIGDYFSRFPEQVHPATKTWRNSGNMWLIRTCILFQLKYKKNTDFSLLQDIILEFKDSDEFFIQKAIGWALRQYAKFSPEEVQSFVNKTELKALSRREALKHFS